MGSYSQIVIFGIVIVVLILFMFRNGRKRAKDAATLAETLKPGAEIMTTFGVFGVIESVDAEENKVVLQTSPTSSITIHRQAVGRVITPTIPDGEDAADEVADVAVLNGEPISIEGGTARPAYGERVTEVPTPEEPTPSGDAGRAGTTNSKRAAE